MSSTHSLRLGMWLGCEAHTPGVSSPFPGPPSSTGGIGESRNSLRPAASIAALVGEGEKAVGVKPPMAAGMTGGSVVSMGE
jgi:hypothetical protein